MNTLEFLRVILPESGLYVIATYPHKSKNGGRDIFHHHPFESLETAAAFALVQREQFDVYQWNHTTKDYVERVTPNGRKYKTIDRSAAAAFKVKCLYGDLDVQDPSQPHDATKFASKEEAISELIAFCKRVGLPKPYVVDSGRGFHVYWPFTAEVDSAAWIKVAEKFKAVAQHLGFRMDPTATADAARVLRPVFTFNRKNPANPIKVTLAMEGVATPYGDLVATIEQAFAEVPAPELIEGRVYVAEDPPKPSAVVKQCPTFTRMAATMGEADEPIWWAMVQLALHTTGGAELAHALSSQHPDYKPAETQERIERAIRENRGPPTCGKLQSLYTDSPCFGCPNFGLPRSSPVVFARRMPETKLPDEIPECERPFLRTKRGVEFQAIPPEGEEPKPAVILYPYDLYPVRIIDDPQNKTKAVEWVAVVPIKGKITVTLPIDAYVQEDKLIAMLVNQGVTVNKHHAKRMGGYVSHYIQKLQEAMEEQEQQGNLGLNRGLDLFVIPEGAITKNGIRPVVLSPALNNVAQGIGKSGTLPKQVEALRFYSHPIYIKQQFVLCSILGAPLMHMLGMYGLLVVLTGPSGASKSTTALAGGGFWGPPNRYVMNGTAGAMTPKARANRIALLASMPYILDEVTHMPAEEIKAFAMNITQPESGTVVLDTRRHERELPDVLKSTIAVMTCNNSLNELLSQNNQAGAAGSYRMIELIAERLNVHTKQQADVFLRAINENHGWIGPEFMQYVLRNYEHVKRSLIRIHDEIERRGKITQQERYWSAGLAVAVLTAAVSKEIGLLDFDAAAMLEWAINEQLPQMRGVVQDNYLDPISALQGFIAEASPNMLVCYPDKGGYFLIKERAPRGMPVARLEPNDKRMWISLAAFRAYCERVKIGYDTTVKHLVFTKVGVREKINLGRFLPDYDLTLTWTLRVDLAHEALSGTAPLQANDGGQVFQFPSKRVAPAGDR